MANLSSGFLAYLRRMLPRLVRIAATVYIGVVALLYLRQDAELFERQMLTPEEASAISARHPRAEEVRIAVDDGVTLHGWFAPGRTAGAAPLIIYFGGNAEEVSWMLDRHDRMPDWSLLLVNYRGYGRSEGTPAEATLLADAVRIHDEFAARADVDRNRIVAMGRSLGTGVAVHLAAARRLSGVVLITPYDSMVAVAQMRYPLIPVDLLLRHRFDSIALAPRIHAPMLSLVAANDEVIPSTQARALQSAWGGPTTWRLFPDTDHGNISRSPAFWQAISEFLATLSPAPR
jgi:hypothetical protein